MPEKRGYSSSSDDALLRSVPHLGSPAGNYETMAGFSFRRVGESPTRIERHTKGVENEGGAGGRQGGKIVLFTAEPRAPFSPHERGASDEVLIACGHKWFLQTLGLSSD